MKFGDKLLELRKKKGYSQEELAEKLGVSRQSVSKWESNNTYPETDKIIQIANLFDCSMDDLINDKVTDVEGSLRKNKNIYNIWDSLLEFITKTTNMFSRMTFSKGLRCVIEMVILYLILHIFGSIICGSLSDIIARIFSFLESNYVNIIKNTLDAIFHLIWFIISLIIIVYSFKIRYLNYYDIETLKENKNKSDNNQNNAKDNIIIRNENERPFEFLGVLSKIVIALIKSFTLLILFGVLFVTIGLVVSDVFMIFLIPVNIIFLWLLLTTLSSTVVSFLVIILLYNFIFDRKSNFKNILIIFIISIIVFGVGIGLSFISFKNIEFINDNSIFNFHTEEINLVYKDNLVIKSSDLNSSNEYKYIIDNTIEDNKIVVSREVDSKYFDLNVIDTSINKLPVSIIEQNNKNDFKFFYNFYIDNLRKNKVYMFSNYGNDPLTIKANENTINNLIINLKKLYLVDEKINNNEIDIKIYHDRVFFENGLRGEYNGIDDSIKYDVENYICKKEIESTSYGERIVYDCDYEEDE